MIRITKEGFKLIEWDANVQDHIEKDLPSTLLRELRSGCEIDDGVSLSDIFNAVDSDFKLKEFLGHYSTCDVESFHREATRPPTRPTTLESLVISAFIEHAFDEVQLALDVSGIDPNTTEKQSETAEIAVFVAGKNEPARMATVPGKRTAALDAHNPVFQVPLNTVAQIEITLRNGMKEVVHAEFR